MTDAHHTWVDPNPPDPVDSRTTAILAASGVVLTVVVVATLIGVVLSAVSGRASDSSIGEAALIAANAPTDEPFTRSILVAPVTISDQVARRSAELLQQVPVRADRGVRPISGVQPELYGTTGETLPCDVVTLANDLHVDPHTARAWGLALGLTPQQIPYYLNTLTPAVLMTDTWVTTHSLSDGVAVAKQAVLQAGNAVLIDPLGVPRVRCASGAPLIPPHNTTLTHYRLDGDAWLDFSPQAVVAIKYAATETPAPATEFTLVDITTGQQVLRRAGGIIDLGGATVPLPDPAVMNIPSAPVGTAAATTVAPITPIVPALSTQPPAP